MNFKSFGIAMLFAFSQFIYIVINFAMLYIDREGHFFVDYQKLITYGLHNDVFSSLQLFFLASSVLNALMALFIFLFFKILFYSIK